MKIFVGGDSRTSHGPELHPVKETSLDTNGWSQTLYSHLKESFGNELKFITIKME